MTVFSQCGDPLAGGACLCQHHGAAYAEHVSVGAPVYRQPQVDDILDNNVIVQQAITITERCCITVNAATSTSTSVPVTGLEIERPGGTIRTTQEDFVLSNNMHLHHHAAWEVLDPGTYTYYLVNRSGATISVYAAWIKIIACDCEG